MSFSSQELLAFPPTRLLVSIAAGLLVSGILSEGLMALLPWFVQGFERLGPVTTALSISAITGQLLTWALAGFVASALASAVAGTRLAGYTAGGLWVGPVLLSSGLAGLDRSLMMTAVLLLGLGTLLGSGLARRVSASET